MRTVAKPLIVILAALAIMAMAMPAEARVFVGFGFGFPAFYQPAFFPPPPPPPPPPVCGSSRGLCADAAVYGPPVVYQRPIVRHYRRVVHRRISPAHCAWR
jgi:hypothetical protein